MSKPASGSATKRPRRSSKPLRSLCLPATAKDFRAVGSIRKLRAFIIDDWLSLDRTAPELALAFLVVVLTDGPSRYTTEKLLYRLQQQDCLGEGWISLPIHPQDETPRRGHFMLSPEARLILAAIRFRNGPAEASDLLLPLARHGDTKSGNERATIFRRLVADFEQHTRLEGPTWHQVVVAGSHIAYCNGAQPVILTLFSQVPLPVSHPHTARRAILRHGDPDAVVPGALILSRGHKQEPGRNKATTLPTRPADTPGARGWCEKVDARMRRLILDLGGITREQFTRIEHRERALACINAALAQASHDAPSSSAEHLMLRWMRSKIVSNEGKIIANSLNDYLERIFYKGFLADPTSRDLSDWEPDDFEYLVENRLESEVLAPATAQSIVSTFKDVFRYRHETEGAEFVDLSELDLEWSGGAGRFELIGPAEFDEYLSCEASSNAPLRQMNSVQGAISFYGGFRPIELHRLMLSDIETADQTCRIRILGGKTHAARRAVPLHRLAPPMACELVRNFVNKRRAEFPGVPLSQVALFGNRFDASSLSRHELSETFKASCRKTFGDFVTPYIMRHCFASWSVIRWGQLCWPEIIDDLPDRSAAIFTPECQARFRAFLSSGGEIGGSPMSVGDLLHIAKAAGHIDFAITAVHYVHTLHIIQSYLVRAAARARNPVLRRDVVDALLKGVRDTRRTGARQTRHIHDVTALLEAAAKWT